MPRRDDALPDVAAHPPRRPRLLPMAVGREGAGLYRATLRGPGPALDPFIAVDHFRLTQAVFAPHPHAGFSAVTMLFDDAETGLLARDSRGHHGVVAPGDLLWTLAGSGLVHEERPLVPGRCVHGLRLGVNLPAADKLQAPRTIHLATDRMPRPSGNGWRARVVFGTTLGATAPIELPVRASLAVIDLAAGASMPLGTAADEHGVLVAVDGDGGGGHGDGRVHVPHAEPVALAAGRAVGFDQPVTVTAGDRPLRLAFLAGRPLNEPLVQHGPFAFDTERGIVDALRRFQAGEMGRLAPLPAGG